MEKDILLPVRDTGYWNQNRKPNKTNSGNVTEINPKAVKYAGQKDY